MMATTIHDRGEGFCGCDEQSRKPNISFRNVVKVALIVLFKVNRISLVYPDMFTDSDFDKTFFFF